MKYLFRLFVIFLIVSNVWCWFHIHALWNTQTAIVQVLKEMNDIQDSHSEKLKNLLISVKALYVSAKNQVKTDEMIVRILHGLYGYDEEMQRDK